MIVAQLCLTLCNLMDYTPPDSSVHGILQARILEWDVFSFSKVNIGGVNRIGERHRPDSDDEFGASKLIID